MRIIATKDYNDMSKKAANILSAQVIMKPDCVLGLATGSTPIWMNTKDWTVKMTRAITISCMSICLIM